MSAFFHFQPTLNKPWIIAKQSKEYFVIVEDIQLWKSEIVAHWVILQKLAADCNFHV